MKNLANKFSISSLILQGIRVLDLSRILVGPLASQMLSDMGAEVIKIESFGGDETRNWGPPFNNSTSTYFLALNRNKKSISIDLAQDEGKKIIYELSSKSDIFLENFSYGVTKKLKIDYPIISAINEKIIYARVSGFGDKGPLFDYPGFDAAIQAYSGLMHITGFKDNDPTKIGVAMTDVLTGYSITCGILAALYERNKSGKGQYVTTSLLETALSSLINIGTGWLDGGVNAQRIGNDHPSIVPYGTYKVKDGKFIMIACGTDLQFEKLIQILQADKILNNIEEFNNNKKRVLNREKLNNLLNEKLCEWEINDLIKKLIEFKIPGAPINDIKTVFESDQVKALNMVENVSSSKYNDLKLIRCPLSFSNNTLNKIQEPPAINEHYNYVLKSILSYDDQKIDWLIDNKIVLKND